MIRDTLSLMSDTCDDRRVVTAPAALDAVRKEPGNGDRQATALPSLGRGRPWSRVLIAAVVGCCVFNLLMWACIRTTGDRWWLGTVLLFVPRWIWLLPIGTVGIWLLFARPKRGWLAAIGLIASAWPLVGPSQAWAPLLAVDSGRYSIRVVSCNADHVRLDVSLFGAWLEEANPDIVFMQDVSTRRIKHLFPAGEWQTDARDGLFVASRFPLRLILDHHQTNSWPKPGDMACYEITTEVGSVRCVNVHLATPRWAFEDFIDSRGRQTDGITSNAAIRRRQFEIVRSTVDRGNDPTLVVGDFNTPEHSWLFRHYLPDYRDAFLTAGWGWGNTHFTRHTAVRIDYLLTSPDCEARRLVVGPQMGSAHRPLFAELEMGPHS